MRRFATLLIIALLADLAAVGGYLWWVHSRVSAPAGQPPFDVGIVFFADFGSDGGLGAESRRRADAAARLYAAGEVPRLLAIGGRRQHPDRFGSALVGERLQQLGVPAQHISVDRLSFGTVSNWQQATTLMREQQLHRPLLISSSLHLARIRHIAERPYAIALAPSQPLAEALRQRPLQSWLKVHREWIAWVAMALLPVKLHRDLAQQWRDLWH